VNTSDMYTRQIVNQIYIAQLYRNADNYRLLRESKSAGIPRRAWEKSRLLWVVLFLLTLAGAFLVRAAV